MAKQRTGPGPGYDGPAYDPVYGPAFDSSLGEPVSPPLIRRTKPPNPNRTPILVVAGVVAVALVAATVVLAVRLTRADQPLVAPPGPAVTDVPKGDAARLVRTLTANGFRCSVQFGTAAGARRGCFATRADTILTSAVFEDDTAGTVTAVRLDARDLSKNAVLRSRTLSVAGDLVGLFGPVVFPGDEARVAAGMRQRSATFTGTWGRFRVANTGDTVELRADRSGRTPLTPVVPSFGTQRKELADALTKTGWRCATSCTKAGQWVDTTIRPEGTTRITAVRMVVTGTGPLDTTREGFHAQVANLLRLLPGDGTGALRAWVSDQRDRGSGSGFVAGWRISVEALYAGDRPAGYQFRLAPETQLASVG